MSNEAVEYVRGIPVVKTFGQTIFSFKKFKNSIDRYEKWVIAYTKQLRGPMLLYTAAINSVFAFLIAAGVSFTYNGVTNEFLLNLLFYIIITPIISITLTKIMFQSENAMIVDDALHRIDQVLNAQPLSEPRVSRTPRNSSVTVQNVSYSYDGIKKALNNISIQINTGQTVAFVGPSGGGKTTLANLIARFFDPQAGQVLIGGINVRDIHKTELMDTVSFVFQNSKLVKASVLENVRMSRPNASREEVMAVLHAAQCTDILEKLPNGADTVIGTKGIYLSGGEQQRIAIARAMLKNAPIILLDEATASLDVENETLIQTALSRLIQNKTVLIIAHRMRTVAGADKIVVLADGNVAEQGTSEELIEKNNLYRHMIDLQIQGQQWTLSKD